MVKRIAIAALVGLVLLVGGFGGGYLVAELRSEDKKADGVVSPKQTPSPTRGQASPRSAPTPTSATATALPEDWSRCTNTVKRYSIGYPGGWVTHHNKPENACNLIDPETFTYPEDSEGPPVAMTTFLHTESVDELVELLTEDSGRKVLKKEEVDMDGEKAVLIELEAQGEGLEEKGTKLYEYIIDHEGRAFSVGTYAAPDRLERYAEFQSVIDRAVKTLVFF